MIAYNLLTGRTFLAYKGLGGPRAGLIVVYKNNKHHPRSPFNRYLMVIIYYTICTRNSPDKKECAPVNRESSSYTLCACVCVYFSLFFYWSCILNISPPNATEYICLWRNNVVKGLNAKWVVQRTCVYYDIQHTHIHDTHTCVFSPWMS